ncbi:MAG: hypothetical protein OXE17_00575 [Chloroflexi bacterium]|nr:hypothetical protein [Chloroflexota bacterium]
MTKNQTITRIDKAMKKSQTQRDAIDNQLFDLAVARNYARKFARDEERARTANNFGPTKRAVADAMFEVLRKERPLHRKVILERIQAKGVPIDSKKPVDYIAQLLTQDASFAREAGMRGYWTFSNRGLEMCQNSLTRRRQLT